MAVIGYGGISLGEHNLLPLASVRQPRAEIANTALDLLTGLISGEHSSREKVLLAPELVVRDSAAGPVAAADHPGQP
jgi:DNA-binding LacI/PurR family transcriptional regulator